MKKLLMALVLMPLMALADSWTDPNTGIEWIFTVTDSEAQVVKAVFQQETNRTISIPLTLGGMPVTSIGERAFDSDWELISVTIPSSVKSIGSFAFFGCKYLVALTLSDGVMNIGDKAFYACESLTSVTIPSSVRSIGEQAFDKCLGMTTLIISEGVMSIGVGAFAAGGITAVTIPSSVTNLGGSAFCECLKLSSVTILDGVTSIGEFAFGCCSGLTSIAIPSSVTSIGDAAFLGCDSLTTVHVSAGDAEGMKAMIADSDSDIDVDSLTFVEPLPDGGPYTETVDGIEWTFSVEGGKAEVGFDDEFQARAVSGETVGALVIPSELGDCPVTGIGYCAFLFCDGLTSVSIPSCVTSIGAGAFAFCSGLTSVEIPSSVTNIEDWAFEGCSGLTSVVIPASVTHIGEGVFAYCGRLASISVDEGNESYCLVDGVLYDAAKKLIWCPSGEARDMAIPEGVTSIGDYAFEGCSGLMSVRIPSTVKSIGDHAFEECSGLTSVTIPLNVTSIGECAFGYCHGLTSISVDEGNATYCSVDGVLCDKAKTKLLCCPGGRTGAAAIPEGVTCIEDHAFEGCSGLTSVTIPSSMVGIGDWTFAGCTGLTSVTIPSSVTSIGDWTFVGCTGLTSVTIPSSVTSIGCYAFYYCSGLETIYVAAGDVEGVKEMIAASDPDLDVDSLTFVEMLEDGGPYTERVDGIEWTFTISEGKATVERDNSEAAIPMETAGAIEIPPTLGGCPVTSIGDSAFYECGGLTSVTIPDGVTRIGEMAFVFSGLSRFLADR